MCLTGHIQYNIALGIMKILHDKSFIKMSENNSIKTQTILSS